ncbi:MAG: leucyl aminopeptidase, partial [Planctomycetaceae bacterium]|nr:leucyl aminopeptidase [Planctomycetaceae bacterium]
AAGELPLKVGATLPLRGLTGIAAPRLLLVGLGAVGAKPQALDRAWMTAWRSIADKPNLRVAALIPPRIAGGPTSAALVQTAVTAAHVGSSGQDLFKAEKSKHPFAGLQVVLSDAATADDEAALNRGRILGESVNLTRELVNRPPAEITPCGFAVRAERIAKQYGLGCEIWDQTRLVQERMKSLLAVSQGSPEPPRLVKLEHRGGGAGAMKIALVGKGVTFDSGGLSLKPTDGMLTMKCDMAGAATVLGAMSAIAQLKLPVNVVGLMGLVENMPGGSAFKLGDILTARNGVTIEVLNTDAEGRLVLADVLSYAVDLGVERIVDLATLTGACVVALGEDVAGAMANDQTLCDQVLAASGAVGEDLWQLPMFDLYDDLIKGDVGDIKNTGGRWGGAISAAKFLQRFVAGKPWVHLDIAGPAFASSPKPHRDGGASGAYVKTLVELVTRMANGRGE